MQIRCLALVLLLFVVLLSGCARFRDLTPPVPEYDLHTFQLQNGLTVYALRNTEVPLVTLDMWVRTGSKDEPAELAGISHFLEHMLFKGTERLGAGDYDRRIEALGGYLNAATSSDYTHYYMTVPSEHLDAALTDMADVLVNSTLAPDEVERERGVILEEISMKQDSPVGFLYDEITRRAYAQGPYAHTVIGTAETVSAMTPEVLREHYRRHYAPENMAFIVVGDFEVGDLRANLEDLLGNFDREHEPWRPEVPETEFSEAQRHVWAKPWQETYFFLTFPGEAIGGLRQAAAADVAGRLLIGARTSRLVNALREKQGLVTSISGFGPMGRHPGFWAFYGTCAPEDTDRVRHEILREIERLREEGPGGEELRRAKRQIITDHLYQTETNTGKASVLGYSFVLFDDTRLLRDYPEVVESVSREDLRAVLDLLRGERASFYVAGPAWEAEATSAAPAR